MSRVVMFVLNDCRTDARVIREAGSLARAGHQVAVMARPNDPSASSGDREWRDGFEIIRVPIPGRFRRLLRRRSRRPEATLAFRDPSGQASGEATGPPRSTRAIVARAFAGGGLRSVSRGLVWLGRWQFGVDAWARAAAAAAPDADVWHGHDLPGLAAAQRARGRRAGRLVYDAHELYLEAGATASVPRWATRIVARLERRWAGSADAVLTVNEGLAEALRGITSRPVVVVHNCPPRWDPVEGQATPLRLAAGVPPAAPLALYHGAFVPFRGIEVLIQALSQPGCEDVHAAFLGSGTLDGPLRAHAATAAVGARMHVLPPVDPGELAPWIAGADVSVVAIAPSTLNHRLSTPNKLFESIGAGTPVVASDFPQIRRIVCDDPEGPLGTTCDPRSAAAVAEGIRSIVEAGAADRDAQRRHCLAAAHARWNWEHEATALLALYGSLGELHDLGGGAAA